MDKDAIAPLVATLLLISFAVALGVVIMNFGRAQADLQAECAIDIGLKLAEIGGEPDLCYDPDDKIIVFTVENGVNIPVQSLIANVIGTKKAETTQLNSSMPKSGTFLGNIPYDKETAGKVRQVKLTPTVILYDEEQICTEKALILEKPKDC